MSAGGESAYVDRSPRQSKAMIEAYAGLADAERYVAECHSAGDWPAHREAVQVMVEWHHEIATIAVEKRR